MNKSNTDQNLCESVQAGEKGYVKVPVIRTLTGDDIQIAFHIIRGKTEGPTLGILACVHGDEHGTLGMMNQFIKSVDPSKLKGTIIVVPAANPLALSHFSRFSIEQHGNVDMHTAFPGGPNGCITQRMAHVITENVLNHVDALVDIHSGGTGGRLQCRVDFDRRLEGETREKTIALCKSYGALLINEHNLSGSASYYVNKKGIPTVNIEVGGCYLGAEASSFFDSLGFNGLMRIARQLGMVDEAEAATVEKSLLFDPSDRKEVNPTVGGFLESKFESHKDLSTFIDEGTELGRILDPYTLETIEELVAPVSGYLFFSRYSGLVEAGTKGFGIAREDNATWL